MPRAFCFVDDSSSFVVTEESLPSAHGAEARLQQAAREVLPNVLAEHQRWMDQSQFDLPEVPVILVCCVDSDLGLNLAMGLGFTHQQIKCVNGPLCWLKTRQEVAGFFGQNAPTMLEKINKIAGGHLFVWAFAVNGRVLQLRVMQTAVVPVEVPADEMAVAGEHD